MRRYITVVYDAVEQVGDLVDEGVLPADDVAVRPPVLPERVMGLGDQHLVKALRLFGRVIDPEHLQLVEALEIETDAALVPCC